MIFIFVLFCNFFALSAFADSKQNIVVKPAIYFDEEIITNIDIQYYRQIISVISQDETDQLQAEDINRIIIDNLAKQKYYEKYINSNIIDQKTIDAEVDGYIKSLQKSLKANLKTTLKNLLTDSYSGNLLKLYIKNEFLWSGVASSVIAQSIQVEPSEIEAFLKIHSNYNQETAYQQLISQKLQPLSYSILEQVKSFTYTKIV